MVVAYCFTVFIFLAVVVGGGDVVVVAVFVAVVVDIAYRFTCCC